MDKSCNLALLLVILSPCMFGQEITHNTPKPSLKIYFLHVNSEIKYRFSRTVITSKVVNPGAEAAEALFDVTLPNEAFMTEFQLIINGTTHKGKVKEKEQAKQEYDMAKSRGQNAGHIVSKPRDSNKFQIQVNVAGAEKVTFELTYQELLRRRTGNYEQTIYINPRQIVDDFRVDVSILEYRNITTVHVPPLRNDILTENEKGENKEAHIVHISAKEVRITYSPTTAQQEALSRQGISGQLIVQYDIQREKDSGEVLVMDGYFVHFLAPEGLDPMPMDIVFILDRSGSMQGNKIKQLQESMLKILDEISFQDRFLLLAFDDKLMFWRKELVQATRSNIAEAKLFITSIEAAGSTDINLAMTEGLKILAKEAEDSRAPVLVFLTDGQPTSGVTNSVKILENIKLFNEVHIPIFSLAYGRTADYDFTKKVAARNNGLGKKIYEDSDAALQISGFYREISAVLMRNISFKYVDGSLNDSTVTQTNFNTYFKGSEFIVAGKIKNITKLQDGIQVFAKAYGDRNVSLSRPLICILPPPRPYPTHPASPTSSQSPPSMMENLWAYLTIKQLLRKKEGLDDKDEIRNMDQKILELSLKYQFVTPMTSMVVTLPDDSKTNLASDDASGLRDMDVSRDYPKSLVGNRNQMMYHGMYGLPGMLDNAYSMIRRRPYGAIRSIGNTAPPATSTSAQGQNHQQLPTFLVNVSSVSMCYDLTLKRSQKYNIINMVQKQGCAITANTSDKVRKTSRSAFSTATVDKFIGRKLRETFVVDESQSSPNIQCNMDGIKLDVQINRGVHIKADIHSRQRKKYNGLLSRFVNMKCKAVKQIFKRGKLVVKIKCRRRGDRPLKLKASLRTGPSGETCFFLNRKMTNLLGIDPKNSELNP